MMLKVDNFMESLHRLYKIGHGPSSSHTMGPENACLYILKTYPNATNIKVTLYGSLALTGKGHLTDVIIINTLKNKKVSIEFNIDQVPKHPNTMVFDLFDDANVLIKSLTILSIGGGEIKIENEKRKCDFTNVYPFKTFNQIKGYCLTNNISLADFVYRFDNKDIKEYLIKVFETMIETINSGLNEKGELPGGLHVLRKANQLFNSFKEHEGTDIKQIRLVSSYAYAVSEENACGGIVVTAPTCGASGVLPSVLYYYWKIKHFSIDKIINSLAVAGLIGNIIKTNASISGAYAGCQSEIGSACSMAAAAIAYLLDESIEEIEYASEIALEHHLGLTCDPINGLVQIPCILAKNYHTF